MRPHAIAFFERFMPHEWASLVAPGWFTCVGLAGVVGLFLMMRIGKRNGVDPGVMASIVLWCYLAAVSAGIIIPMVIDGVEGYLAHGRFSLHWAGMTSFWGYLAGITAVAAVCRHHRVPLAKLGDLAAPAMGVALFFSRLGCFLGGCDYGKVTSVPWAMRFPQGSPAWVDHVNAGLVPASRGESLPVHPTQLYEALLGLVILGVVIAVARTAWAKQRQGRVFLAACATYAVGRIFIETLRADLGRGIYLGLSSGQIFSIFTLLVVASALLVTRRRLIATLATAGVACALMIDPHAAAAQPAPDAPPPASPTPALPPDPPPTMTVYAPPPNAMQPPPYTLAPQPLFGTTHAVGLLLDAAAPLNRRNNQVKAFTGVTLSANFLLAPMVTLGVDFDSIGNADATHGTLLISGGVMLYPDHRFRYGGRFGMGPTLVNFHDPVFRDIAGFTTRIEGVAEYDLTNSWMLWIRPLSFDYLTAADLGGPIVTWQFRVGIAYKWGPRRYPPGYQAAPPPPPAAYPAYPPPPPPLPPAAPANPYPTYPGPAVPQ